MEGLPKQPFDQIPELPQRPKEESVESLPLFEYTFCNNHDVLQSILAPNGEIARDRFLEKEGRVFGTVEGDSVTRIPTKDVLFTE